MKLPELFAAASALTFAIATPALADIDTTGSKDGTVQTFGSPNTATYGQTFVAGAGDTSILSFSMFLDSRSANFPGAGPLDVKGYLATWTGSMAGAILYTGTVQTMNAAGLPQEFHWDTGGLGVTPGSTYVAFLSVSELPTQPDSGFQMPYMNDSIDGQFVYLNNGTDFGALTTNGWNAISTFDAWLKVDFGNGAVPEPASWAMMIGGLGLVGAAMRRTRRLRPAIAFA